MEIERNISNFIILEGQTILEAINKANTNLPRLVFVLSESGVLEGVLTDGDLRRWLTSTSRIDFNLPISKIMNKDFISASVDTENLSLTSLLSHQIKAIPLLDSKNRLVAVALHSKNKFKLKNKPIGEESPTFIIAEIGNNHNGSLDLALEMIDKAIESGADCVKFQMRNMDELYGNSKSKNKEKADLGTQYTLELLSKFQLTDAEMFKAFDYCERKGVIALCTPWDLSSLKKLEGYNLPAYKIASADFTNYELIDEVARLGKLMFCSTGMATENEVRDGIRHLNKNGCPFILLHCNSTYPAPFKDINLNYIKHLKKLSGGIVGYSGHERGINISIAAVSLGAKVIEKHFTLDKEMEGVDHKVSLLPEEFNRMVKGIRQVEESMADVTERRISQGEMMNRENLAKSLVATQNIKKGTIVTEKMISIKSPGQGLQPSYKSKILGKILETDKKKGDFFFENDITNKPHKPKDYKFNRSWGVPVRYHDFKNIYKMSNMDLLELHLSYTDMELDFKEYLKKPMPLDLVIHAPELFKGDHTLDLCSKDKNYRKRSIEEMQRTIDLTLELKDLFTNSSNVLIVTNVGGFTNDRHLEREEHEDLYLILLDSLGKLNTEGVEIIPQTMPPFPWHFGGQQFHNLFVDDESIAKFCATNEMRICLDTSHSKLACNYLKRSFTEFTKKVAPYIAHMHLADAEGVDGEGIQIGEGEIDWKSFIQLTDKLAPKASFIPEIWQGHKNNSEGAWKALNALSEISY